MEGVSQNIFSKSLLVTTRSYCTLFWWFILHFSLLPLQWLLYQFGISPELKMKQLRFCKVKDVYFTTCHTAGYTLSYFVIRKCFRKTLKKIWNTDYTLFIFHANFVFYSYRKEINYEILWHFPQKPTPTWNAKSEKRDAKREKSDVKYPAIHFLFFAFFCGRFHIFCDKYTAGLRAQTQVFSSSSYTHKSHTLLSDGNKNVLEFHTVVRLGCRSTDRNYKLHPVYDNVPHHSKQS